ncbi:Tetratricopeptide repeat-containing protein [Mariniphaga anaerophila]|uniref:Tetratricopeptide repeat-containing protein n=1 Tax=Mariniphaga anaerophila TaxID=1484053 RepID=A0A1M5CL47_9BACT|nr:tetratricopeptide repeat protein [Mariniphaga anaerophila]SHF55439.1 Tetratricopeptide repeat-containing protein [Mariniphaga anaerophila]
MMKQYTKHIVVAFFLLFGANVLWAQAQPNEIQSATKLALSYYNAKDYEKAAPLLLEVYNLSKNNYYFRLYLNSMIEMQDFEGAETFIQKELKKQRTLRPDLLIHWGYLLKAQKKLKEADEKYTEALKQVPANKGSILVAANSFMQWQEFEWSKKVYLKGRKEIPQEQFNYELARNYLYLRDYDKMMEEYLNLIRQDDKQIQRVQSALSSAMRIDVDGGLRQNFREQILKRIQAEPSVIVYNRLLIWFFLQEKQFAGALRQALALDRRTGEEDTHILQMGQMALNNKMYDEAERAFNYLVEKGENSPLYIPAFVQNIRASYMRYTTSGPESQADGNELAGKFESSLEMLGYSVNTLGLIHDYAHLLAFYLNDSEKAISILEKGLKLPLLKPEDLGILKTELADIYVYAGDPWEATLLYSQVIDANKNNTLGDEVKLKKARLGYYMGNFSWAKAQLDVLKASTSKLTANDAMELSMLIGNNLNLDTTAVPLQMFARADLLFFRNKESEAMTTLDSIAEIYPFHSLTDNILFRKAKIEIDRNNYTEAAGFLQEITDNFSSGLLADDALFMLAELCNFQLNEKERAKELYRDMLSRFPGSVFTEESRQKFRELREIYPDAPVNPQEELFIQDTIPNEIN